MKIFDFRVTLGARNFTKRICAENYTVAYNIVTVIYPLSAVISLDKAYEK